MSDLPRLVREAPAPARGIVHFGPGAFFRAFVARYTDDAMAANGGAWGITAVSLQSERARDQLGPQGGAYTAVELSPEGPAYAQVGSVLDVLVAPEDPAAVIRALADPNVHVVTLTITEKGYPRDKGTGGLALDHPDVAHDLASPSAPRSAIGFLVAGFAARKAADLMPYTVMSCDNLPENGHLLRRLVLDMAMLRDPGLADWIDEHGAFPSSMVDRITPAATEKDIIELSSAIGAMDLGMVQHEPFRQWVIEDRFAGPRPAWDAVGAQMVAAVSPYEHMKLRCLNGVHSTLAYLGYLSGHQTIADAVAEPAIAALCRRLWREEILPTVPKPEGEDLEAYCEALLKRFANPNIQHRTWQIAMDGSEKLPQRILATIFDLIQLGRPTPGLCLAVAAWMRYVSGKDEQGAAIDVRDPRAAELRFAMSPDSSPTQQFDAIVRIRGIISAELASLADFKDTVVYWLERLEKQGSAVSIAEYSALQKSGN